MIGVVILNFEDWHATERNLKSILDFEQSLSIVIIDNGSLSTKDYFGTTNENEIRKILFKKYEFYILKNNFELKVIRNDKNIGFSCGHNVGLSYLARHGLKFVCCLNSDLVFNAPSISEMRSDIDKNGSAIGSFAILDRNGELDGNLYRKLKSVTNLIREIIFGTQSERKSAQIVENGSLVEVPSGAALMFNMSRWTIRPPLPSDIFLYNEEFVLGTLAKRLNVTIFQSSRLPCVHLGGLSSTGKHILQIKKTFHQAKSIYVLYHRYNKQNLALVLIAATLFILKNSPVSVLKDAKYFVQKYI